MSFTEEDFEVDDSEENPKELYGIRDGILFIIDATPPMFENDPHEGIPYFLQCIRKYKEILKQKLVWNRQDWMGLTLFGIEKSDTDSEMKHIFTLQKLKLVSVDDLKEIMKIDEGQNWKHYKNIASSTVYPLHDVLWHAARTFSSIDVTMPMRKIILFTCQDNPPLTNKTEMHRIRVKATSYSDIGLQLRVVGLGQNWNHDQFYKDLEMLSEKIDTDDYVRTSLEALLEEVQLPSRSMAKLPWRLGQNVIIDVSVHNVAVKTQYLKKDGISKETNIPLDSNRYLKMADNSDNETYMEDKESEQKSMLIFETEVQKYQEFGGKKIYFTPAEIKSLSTTRKPGIDLICVKPIFYHPLYHFGTPYFVIPSKSYRKDNKLLFGALLNKCDSRNLMIVCAVTIREHSASNLYVMIPSAKDGGFYLYKVPFKENVRNLSEYYSEYIYDDNKNKPPSDTNGVQVLEKMIKKLKINYNPKNFHNPKLQVQLQAIEILALDLERSEPPPDATLPMIDEMRERVEDFIDAYNEIFYEKMECTNDMPPKKKVKKTTEVLTEPAPFDNKEKIRKLVIDGKVESFTVPQLKDMLKILGLKTSGKKDELISRIKKNC